MKKVSTVSLFSLAFLSASSLVAYLLKFVSNGAMVAYTVAGLLLLVISGLFALFAKKDLGFNIACSAISAVALGFLIKAWYILRGFLNPLWMMLAVSAAAVAYLWVFFLLARIPFFKRHSRLFSILFILLSFAGYTAVVFTTKTTFVSTFGYYMIIELAFIYAMCRSTADLPSLVRAMTLSTYSVFAVALIVLTCVVIDGDLDFDLDFDLDLGDSVAGEAGSEALSSTLEAITPDRRRKKK